MAKTSKQATTKQTKGVDLENIIEASGHRSLWVAMIERKLSHWNKEEFKQCPVETPCGEQVKLLIERADALLDVVSEPGVKPRIAEAVLTESFVILFG